MSVIQSIHVAVTIKYKKITIFGSNYFRNMAVVEVCRDCRPMVQVSTPKIYRQSFFLEEQFYMNEMKVSVLPCEEQ